MHLKPGSRRCCYRCVFFSESNACNELEKELELVTQKHKANELGADFLFVFDDQATKKPVGFTLLTGRNDSAGFASHLEIRMFAIAAEDQGKGLAKEMLTSVIKATPGHRLDASCLPAAIKMMRLLTGFGFVVTDETRGGKKTFSTQIS
ncbi:TPA: GNAT family N-acetyltransferase [Escherichia coli]